MDETALRYPIGRFTIADLEPETSVATRLHRIERLAETPTLFGKAVTDLAEAQLDTPYRPGGWSVRQVVHHMADSHLQSYAVFKNTLTSVDPLLPMYDCPAWGEFPDARTCPVESSLDLLRGLHGRWDGLLRSMAPPDFSRTFQRPEWGGPITLDSLLQIAEWHCRHHLAHITNLRKARGW